jgi:hypothetical protein
VAVMIAAHFDDRGAAARAVDILRHEGYDAELQDQPDGSTVLAATPPAPLTTAGLPNALARVGTIAADLGGELIGHGGIATVGIGNDGAQ